MNPAAGSFFIGRAGELRLITDALLSPTSVGAVLVGPAGIGKTALLQRALLQSKPQFHVVRLRGSTAMAENGDYSALNSLLTDLEDEEVAHPVTMLRALAVLLRTRSEGRQVILAVDNVELLDAGSATIISQLVSIGAAKVLLTARHFNLADAAFMALWRKGSLLRVDVEALSLKESALFCEAELGSFVSGDVVRTVHRLTGGCPKLLRGCLREVQRQGLLVRGATSWVLGDGLATPCREAAAATIAHLESLGTACRDTALLVAFSGGLPLSVLLRLTSFTAVDSLQGAGLLTVGKDRNSTVRCATSVIAGGIKLGAGQEDARAAYELVLTADEWTVSELHPHHLASWRHKAGLTLDDALVARAARRLNDTGRYSEALELGGGGHASGDDAVLMEMLRARAALGDFEGFTVMSGSMGAEVLQDAGHGVRWLLMCAEVSLRSGSGPRPDLLDQAQDLASGPSRPGTAPEVADEVLVSRAELLAFDGRYHEVAAILLARKQDRRTLTDDTRVRIDTLLCEAWSLGVQQLDAMELARSMAGFLLENEVTARTRTGAYAQIWETHRTAGDVDGAHHIRQLTTQRSIEVCFAPRSYEEVSRALALAHHGHEEEALRILLPAFDQLRLSDPWGVLPAAAAGISYCYARQGELQPMSQYLRHSEGDGGTSWKIRQTARYFRILASSHTDDRVAAGRELRKLALEGPDTHGSQFMRMLVLFRAVRLGNHDALDALGSVSAQLQGPFARLSELYAKGLGSQDCEFLLRSMEMASGMGDVKLAREAAQHALRIALTADDKQTLRHVQRQIRTIAPDSEEWGIAGARLTGLTRREREVAFAAAAGATNRDIAESLYVSVRTVEGHLYQVYTKLNVCTRAELADLIPAGQVQP